LADLLDDYTESTCANCFAAGGHQQPRDTLLDKLIQDKSKRRRAATLSSYLTKVARLGGYLARTKDPPPGNAVMWRGLARLTDIELGFIIGAQLVGN